MRITRTMNSTGAASKGEHWIDAFGAFVLAAGISALVFELRGYQASFWLVTFVALVQVGLAVLLSRRWWLAPLFLASGILIGLSVIWRTGSEAAFMQSWRMAFSWFREFFLLAEPAPGQHLVLTFGLILPIAILLFTAVRLINNLWFYLLWPAAFFLPVLIWHPDAILYYLVVLAGFLIQVPRTFVREIRRLRPQDAVLPRAPMQWLAIPVVLISLLLANGLVPARTLDWRLEPLANWVQDWQDLWQNTFGPARTWMTFNLAGFGYGNTSDQLGGPVSLITDLILRVKADRPVLLKGSTRTYYTGHSWQKAPLPCYRFDSPLWRSQRRHTFADALPSDPEGRQFANSWQRTGTLEITHARQLTTLFSTGNVRSIQVPDRLNYAPYFSVDSNLFTFAYQPSLFKYTVEISLLDRRLPGFDPAVLAAEQDLANGSGADQAFAQAQADDLQLPAELPEIVRETALRVTAQAATPYAKALALEQYLKDQGIYTLQPDMPPSGVDFVAHFLATRKDIASIMRQLSPLWLGPWAFHLAMSKDSVWKPVKKRVNTRRRARMPMPGQNCISRGWVGWHLTQRRPERPLNRLCRSNRRSPGPQSGRPIWTRRPMEPIQLVRLLSGI